MLTGSQQQTTDSSEFPRLALKSILQIDKLSWAPPKAAAWAPAGVHTWTWLLSQELQVIVNSGTENTASVTFFKTTWHVEASGHLLYFGRAVWIHFMVLLCNFSNQVLILVTIRYNCLRVYCDAFFLWNSSSVLWAEILLMTFHRHEEERVMTEFSFLGELYLWRRS